MWRRDSGGAEDALTSLTAIHALTNAQAAEHNPVAFEAPVTYYRDYERTLFVQDGDTAIFVLATTGLKLMPGDRIGGGHGLEPVPSWSAAASMRPAIIRCHVAATPASTT